MRHTAAKMGAKRVFFVDGIPLSGRCGDGTLAVLLMVLPPSWERSDLSTKTTLLVVGRVHLHGYVQFCCSVWSVENRRYSGRAVLLTGDAF